MLLDLLWIRTRTLKASGLSWAGYIAACSALNMHSHSCSWHIHVAVCAFPELIKVLASPDMSLASTLIAHRMLFLISSHSCS